MTLLVGTDEAGYGPNLGPLTIGGSVWRCPGPDIDLYQSLKKVIARRPHSKKIQIADSKAVYSSANGLENLERNVLALVQIVHGCLPDSWNGLAEMLGFSQSLKQTLGLFQSDDLALPVESDPISIGRLAERAGTEFQRQGIELLSIQVCTIFPDEFNGGVKFYENKASFLSAMTMKWVGQLMELESGDGEDCRIGCDKHGGRSHYAGLINQFLTDQLVQVVHEGRDSSRYRWTDGDRLRDIAFSARGESFLPTALASMAAKYVRQLAMTVWNKFWCERIPDLQPTQGYPSDAQRFKSQIGATLKQLDVAEHKIWRSR